MPDASAATPHDQWFTLARQLLDGLREAEAAAEDLDLPMSNDLTRLRREADNYLRGVPA